MTRKQKRRPENTKTWKKAKEIVGHQRAVCPGIKDRKMEDRIFKLADHSMVYKYIVNE